METPGNSLEDEFLEEYGKLCEKYNLRIAIYDEDALCLNDNDSGYRETIYTSAQTEAFYKSRKENEIKARKERFGKLGIPYDENGNELKREGPELPPQNYDMISWRGPHLACQSGQWIPLTPEHQKKP